MNVDDQKVLCCGYASQFPGLLTWGPQTSRGLWIESRKSMNLVVFLSNRLILPSPVFYFMHLQTLFWGGSVGITRYAGIMAHKQMNKQNSFEPFQFLLQEVFLDLLTSGLLLTLCFPHYYTQHVGLYWFCYRFISPMRAGALRVLFTTNVLALVYSWCSVIACWMAGWISRVPAHGYTSYTSVCLFPTPPGIL